MRTSEGSFSDSIGSFGLRMVVLKTSSGSGKLVFDSGLLAVGSYAELDSVAPMIALYMKTEVLAYGVPDSVDCRTICLFVQFDLWPEF